MAKLNVMEFGPWSLRIPSITLPLGDTPVSPLKLELLSTLDGVHQKVVSGFKTLLCTVLLRINHHTLDCPFPVSLRVLELQGSIDMTMNAFEVIGRAKVLLDDVTMSMKWEVFGWPQKVKLEKLSPVALLFRGYLLLLWLC